MSDKFKVIGVDNFDRDNVSDILVVDMLSESAANEVAASLNRDGGDYAPRFYKVKSQDYKLYKWEP